MNRLTAFIIFCIVAIVSIAQQKADIEVSYIYSHTGLNEQNVDLKMNLLTSSKLSKYYNSVSEFLDSLRSTPEGNAKYREMVQLSLSNNEPDKILFNPTHEYIVKSFDSHITTFYDALNLDFICYDESHNEFNWTIGDSTTTILGYECVDATCNYHGRKWSVWFSPDIPISDGPWKFCGLPGLILAAEESSGKHSFTATGIERSSKTIQPIYNKTKYEKISYYDYLNAVLKSAKNPGGAVAAQFGVTITSKYNKEKSVKDYLIETDL